MIRLLKYVLGSERVEMDVLNIKRNKNKHLINNLIIFISVTVFVGIHFFEESTQHYFYSVKNGHEIKNAKDYRLNKELFSIVSSDNNTSILKLRGYLAKELTINMTVARDKLSDAIHEIDETNVIVNNENCVVVAYEGYVVGYTRYIIQHQNSRVGFIFEAKINSDLVNKICDMGVIKQ